MPGCYSCNLATYKYLLVNGLGGDDIYNYVYNDSSDKKATRDNQASNDTISITNIFNQLINQFVY